MQQSQNAQTLLLNTIEALLEDGEIDKALDALLELDTQTQAGLRSDLITVSGSYRTAYKEYKVNQTIDFAEYNKYAAKARVGLLALMQEIPERIKINAQLRGLDTYQFEVPDTAHLEKIIGQQNNLLKINWLERALKASKAVCRVVCANGELGTGFLTKEGYLFTNNHVIADAKVAETAKIEFNYEFDSQGKVKSRTAYQLDATDFKSSVPTELDYVRVKVKDRSDAPLSQWGYVEFDPSAIPVVGEGVTIIQHPKGEDKQIALNANDVISVWGQYLFYATDTEPGSSGSPVFNKDWKVVALHHAGRTDKEGGMQINAQGERRGANRGILFEAIFAQLGGKAAPLSNTGSAKGKESFEETPTTPPATEVPVTTPVSRPEPQATVVVPEKKPAPVSVSGPLKIVLLYDIADEVRSTQLNKHLTVLKMTKKLSVYNVHQSAVGGDDVEAAADQAIAEADYVFCLISSNLFNDDALWLGKTLVALEAGKRVVPVRLDKADIEGTGLEKLRSLPSLNRVVADFPNTEAAYADIAEEIKKLVKR